MAVSFAVFIFINPKVGIIPEIIALVLFGFSIAVTAGPSSRQLIDHLPKNEKEIWSSDNMAIGFISQAIGTAVWALLFTLLNESNCIEITFSELSSDGFMHGFKIIMGLGMLLFIISGLIHIFIRDKKDTL